MKKVFSLLLVVAMLASLSLVAFAAEPNAAGGMHTVITDNGATATVEIYVTNVEACAGFNSILLTEAATYVEDSAVLGEKFATCTLNDTQNKTGQIKMIGSFSDLANYVTEEGTLLAVSYTVNKVDATTKLTEADFAYGNKALTASKIPTSAGYTVAGQTAGSTNFTSVKFPAYFTIAVDAGSDFDATVAGTTITCTGKVDATVENYGVVFTAESTVEGARAQKYYGAMNGDTVKDYNGSTTFTFGDWDGTFEIILEGVHAGEKELDFFVNDTVIADTNFTLTVE